LLFDHSSHYSRQLVVKKKKKKKKQNSYLEVLGQRHAALGSLQSDDRLLGGVAELERDWMRRRRDGTDVRGHVEVDLHAEAVRDLLGEVLVLRGLASKERKKKKKITSKVTGYIFTGSLFI
jgi:hypothetical protein